MDKIPPPQLQSLFILIETLFAAGAVLMSLIVQSQEKGARFTSWLKYISYFFILHIIVCSIIFNRLPFMLLFLLVSLAAVFEVVYTPVKTRLIRKKPLRTMGVILLFCIVLCNFTFFLLMTPSVKIITLYILVAILDAFSQLTGQLLGKHKLAPKISPAKTIEGLIGGLFICALATVLLRNNLSLTVSQAVLFGLILGLTGSAGDLYSSFYKRQNGIKDYSSILPGHGGFMDRFISFFTAANAAGLYYYLNRMFI